jgi:hypothetical protein
MTAAEEIKLLEEFFAETPCHPPEPFHEALNWENFIDI